MRFCPPVAAGEREVAGLRVPPLREPRDEAVSSCPGARRTTEHARDVPSRRRAGLRGGAGVCARAARRRAPARRRSASLFMRVSAGAGERGARPRALAGRHPSGRRTRSPPHAPRLGFESRPRALPRRLRHGERLGHDPRLLRLVRRLVPLGGARALRAADVAHRARRRRACAGAARRTSTRPCSAAPPAPTPPRARSGSARARRELLRRPRVELLDAHHRHASGTGWGRDVVVQLRRAQHHAAHRLALPRAERRRDHRPERPPASSSTRLAAAGRRAATSAASARAGRRGSRFAWRRSRWKYCAGVAG
jgi:hypothetical protein